MEYTAALIFYIVPLLLQSLYFHSQSIVEYTKPRSSPFYPCVLSLLPGPLKYRPRAQSTMSLNEPIKEALGITQTSSMEKKSRRSFNRQRRATISVPWNYSTHSQCVRWYLGTSSASHCQDVGRKADLRFKPYVSKSLLISSSTGSPMDYRQDKHSESIRRRLPISKRQGSWSYMQTRRGRVG